MKADHDDCRKSLISIMKRLSSYEGAQVSEMNFKGVSHKNLFKEVQRLMAQLEDYIGGLEGLHKQQ